MKRTYRGCRLQIKVSNPDHVQHGVKELRVNGKPVSGNIILPEMLQKGTEVEIEAVMESLQSETGVSL